MHNIINQRGNSGKADPASKKRRDRHLIGGIQDSWHHAASLERLSCQRETGIAAVINGKKIKPPKRHKIEWFRVPDQPVRPFKRIGNRRFHIGCPHLPDDRPITEIDKPMDRHLRMDQHLDRVTLKTEQPGRLDHLKPLVHHRRAVDRNLLPHAPIRMFDRLRRGDCWKIGQRHGAKRSARRGQTYMADFLQSVTCWHSKLGMVRLPSGPALKNGVMLTVEWQNPRTVFAGGLHHDTAC